MSTTVISIMQTNKAKFRGVKCDVQSHTCGKCHIQALILGTLDLVIMLYRLTIRKVNVSFCYANHLFSTTSQQIYCTSRFP